MICGDGKEGGNYDNGLYYKAIPIYPIFDLLKRDYRPSPSNVPASYRFGAVTLSFCMVLWTLHEESYRYAGFGQPRAHDLDLLLLVATISFCKVSTILQNTNWVQDNMAARNLLPIAHAKTLEATIAIAVQNNRSKV